MALETLRINNLDGTHIDVVPNLFDQRNFERALRNNRSWGTLQDNFLRLQAFRAWSAATRAGAITLTWEQFYEDPNSPVQSVTVVDDSVDDDDADDDGESLEVPGVGKGTREKASTTSS